MTYKNLEHSIKDILNDAAQEIQENPYAKQKFFDAIKEKESCKMKNKRFFGKKAVIALTAVICLTAGTAVATGGHLASWTSHYDPLHDATYDSAEAVMAAQEDFEFTPVVVEEFDNGYAFDEARLGESQANDDENNVLATVDNLDVEYVNADGEMVNFHMEKLPPALREQIMAEEIAPDSVQTYKGINIRYNFVAQKCVGGHYEPTAEEEALMEAGKLNIMYDSEESHEPELFNLVEVHWYVDDVEYMIFAFDTDSSIGEDDLFAMAKQVIDKAEQ